MFNKICVIGLGYIGLPTAAIFAKNGLNVKGVDINQDIINTINRGEIHIKEPHLEEIVHKCVSDGTFEAMISPVECDAYIIAVPTPFIENEDGIPKPDISYIMDACKSFSKILKKGDLIIIESTSPVGTTKIISNFLSKERPDLSFPTESSLDPDVFLAYCPERVIPGNVIFELANNERVVGGMTQKCAYKASQLYEKYLGVVCNITNAPTAEMTKLTENASRDVQIAFANELSLICDEAGINVWELISLANKHPRVNILQPGPGVGGHCIAVDPWFIVSENKETAKLIRTSREINDSKPQWVVNKITEAVNKISCDNEFKDPKIILYGLTFKPNIDDLRESPALKISKKINEIYNNVFAVEPNINLNSYESIPIISINEAIKEGHLHVFLVKHDEFFDLQLVTNNVIDTVGILSNEN